MNIKHRQTYKTNFYYTQKGDANLFISRSLVFFVEQIYIQHTEYTC